MSTNTDHYIIKIFIKKNLFFWGNSTVLYKHRLNIMFTNEIDDNFNCIQ